MACGPDRVISELKIIIPKSIFQDLSDDIFSHIITNLLSECCVFEKKKLQFKGLLSVDEKKRNPKMVYIFRSSFHVNYIGLD